MRIILDSYNLAAAERVLCVEALATAGSIAPHRVATRLHAARYLVTHSAPDKGTQGNPMLRLMLVLPFLASCVVTNDAPAQVVLSSSSTGEPVASSGAGLPPVMTSTEAGSMGSGETTGDASASSSGDASSTSTASTGEGSTSTTGEAPPACRNDDPDAVCHIFVSSVEAPPNILASGFNKPCNDLACNASMTCGEYIALIRVDGNFWSAYDTFTGSHTLPSGAVVAAGEKSLALTLPINEDETGAVVSSKAAVWTGFSATFLTCEAGETAWSSNSANAVADVGYVGGEGESKWMGELLTCDSLARVYCAEVPQ